MVQEEVHNREKQENLYKFNFVELAQKMGDKPLTRSRKYEGGSGNLVGSKEANGKSSLTSKPK